MTGKTCNKCAVHKPLADFSPVKGGKFGRKAVCKICYAAGRAAWVAANNQAANDYAAQWRAANPERVHAADRKWKADNPEKQRVQLADYTKRHPEKRAKWQRESYERNREKRLQYALQWRCDHPGVVSARVAARRAAQLQATPPWVDHTEILRVYQESARLTLETGIPHEVDHIIPLRGRNVCGLHVPWNLQAIPAEDNRRKGNRH
jgi:hypothetical protein